jgi:ParB-like chromosome segregation protein Spo0J
LSSSPTISYITIPLSELVALRRNPQYLSEKQSTALRKSIARDGFLAPIVVRRKNAKYEILSGNHRVLGAREEGLTDVPACLVDPCDDKRAARIAINMNTVHGDPTPELMAPFLADLETDTMREVFLDDGLLKSICDFDATLKERLDALMLPDALDRDSRPNIPDCKCPKCGARHVAPARKNSKPSKLKARSTRASKAS